MLMYQKHERSPKSTPFPLVVKFIITMMNNIRSTNANKHIHYAKWLKPNTNTNDTISHLLSFRLLQSNSNSISLIRNLLP